METDRQMEREDQHAIILQPPNISHYGIGDSSHSLASLSLLLDRLYISISLASSILFIRFALTSSYMYPHHRRVHMEMFRGYIYIYIYDHLLTGQTELSKQA
jgi:hypothetical protein